MRKMLAELKQGYLENRYMHGEGPVKAVISMVLYHIGGLWAHTVCAINGHDYESCADAENGTEDVWCNRCGYEHHVQF